MNGRVGPEKTLCSLSLPLLPRWAEQPNPPTSRAESEFDPVQGPFPDWEGSPPTPSKDREEDFVPLPVGLQRCPTCSRFVRGVRSALRQHQFALHLLVASQHAQAQQQRSPATCAEKCGDHWGRTQHSRFCPGRRPAHPTNDWDDEWHDHATANDPAYWSWNERQEPANNSDSYQVAGAWRWGQHEWADHSSNESYCHSEWGEWTTSWQERQHGWQEAGQYNPKSYENENWQDDQNQCQPNGNHQPNRDRWRHEEQPSGGGWHWWQDHQETDYYDNWRQASAGHWHRPPAPHRINAMPRLRQFLAERLVVAK